MAKKSAKDKQRRREKKRESKLTSADGLGGLRKEATKAKKAKKAKRERKADGGAPAAKRQTVHREVRDMPAAEYRAAHKLVVTGLAGEDVDTEIDMPIQSFEALGAAGVPAKTIEALVALGHASPTAVQAQCWPLALAGLDLVCRYVPQRFGVPII